MKFLIVILFLSFTLIAFGQGYPDSGFTNKAEAKIDTTDSYEGDGKWVTYLESDGELAGSDTTAPFYCLTVYKDGNPYGIEKEYYKSGKLHKITSYVNGERNGTEKGYYESGALYYEENWKNNKRNGINKYYYESGILRSEINYTDGLMNGVWKQYDERGKLKNAIPYTNGVEDSKIKIDENGNEIK